MREIFSGDLIQFGVEVMENNRRGEKSEHLLLVATNINFSSLLFMIVVLRDEKECFTA